MLRILATRKAILKLLSCQETKRTIYNKYVLAAKSKRAVSLVLFRKIWASCCSDIVIQLPRTYLCVTCQRSYTSKAVLVGANIETELKFFKDCEEHLRKVQLERQAYIESIEVSRLAFQKNKLDRSPLEEHTLTTRTTKLCIYHSIMPSRFIVSHLHSSHLRSISWRLIKSTYLASCVILTVPKRFNT